MIKVMTFSKSRNTNKSLIIEIQKLNERSINILVPTMVQHILNPCLSGNGKFRPENVRSVRDSNPAPLVQELMLLTAREQRWNLIRITLNRFKYV